MRLSIGVSHVAAEKMCVQLRRGNVRVSEKLLDDAKVGAPVEEVGREGVTQGVGMDFASKLCRAGRDPYRRPR